MKLIIGLGNPDPNYALTRHNFGWRVIDALAHSYGTELVQKSKFSSLVAETSIDGEKVLLVKPLLYYNNSGQVVRQLVDFYKLSTDDILVIHDELALPLGQIRTRLGGSPAGNNGIKSIAALLGPDFARIRIGVSSDLKHRMPDADFVLSRFSQDEESLVGDILPHIIKLVDQFIAGNFDPDTIQVAAVD